MPKSVRELEAGQLLLNLAGLGECHLAEIQTETAIAFDRFRIARRSLMSISSQ